MDNKLKFQQLECYKLATDEQKEKLNKEQYFDLDKLPGNQLQTEFVEYIYYRGTQVSILTIKRERHYFNSLCEFFQKSSHQENSLLDREKDFWIKQLKMWMIQNGRALTKHKVTNIQTESVEKAALIRYFESLLEFTLDRSETNELAKDIWHLERLPLILRTNPIVNHKTLNFRGIRQPDIREKVKKAIYHHLKTEALGSIKRELSAMNKFSKYLDEKHSKISTCEEIDREIIEQFLINIKVESNGGNGIRDDLLKLRNVLETIGKIYDFPHLTKLFLKSDFPPERKAEFKSYSDSELKRLNAQIVKMEEQIARAMIIHQMLGTRISDTLTLRKDCLYKHDRQDMIIIYQPKTRRYEKPISRELAQLIGKAVSYANEHYPESIYIFADENKPERPISYQTLQDKVLRMIYEKDIRDDSGNLFGFGTHMFRHCYGVKLTELHVDDWTIAKLLGHKGVRSVQYYRKMSNQRMADETREVRNFMSQIILASLDGWEKNMSKYDKMLELNKRKSEEKVERAVLTIRTMVLEREKVSVPALMQKTGLSRGFFYKNPIVRGEIDAAMEQQAGMVDPRRNIISQAMEAEMNLLRQQLQKLKSENENLIKENQKLKKALSKKELNLIKQI